MHKLVEWSKMHRSIDVSTDNLYTLLDIMSEKYLKKVILKQTKLTVEELRDLKVNDIVTCDIDKQYAYLIGHILATGPANIPVSKMTRYIEWMVSETNMFETGVIAWIWCNSALNNLNTHKSHSEMISIIDGGCDYSTLRFVWDVANSDDVVLINATSYIAKHVGANVYLKYIVYTWLCSNLPAESLNAFFCDIGRVSDSELIEFENHYCSFLWSKEVISELFEKNYSFGRLWSYIKLYGNQGIMDINRKFPTSVLPSKVFPIHITPAYGMIPELPQVPVTYTIDHHLFCEYMPDTKSKAAAVEAKSKYEIWYESLTQGKRNALRQLNPIAHEACERKQFHYVSQVLDALMLEV